MGDLPIVLDSESCRNLDLAMQTEWLVTNGLGGYASGTVAGANARKYHGYLVVAAKPPVQRYVVLSRVEDSVILGAAAGGGVAGGNGGGVYDLSTDEFSDVVHPQGYKSLVGFEVGQGPVWRYAVGDAVIEKSITLAWGQDAVVVRYRLVSREGVGTVKLLVQPMLAGRDFHGMITLQQRPWWTLDAVVEAEGGIGVLSMRAAECPVPLHVSHNADKFTANACWWYNFTYRCERQRGYPDREDLWTPGVMEFTLKVGEWSGFVASTRPVTWGKAAGLVAEAEARHKKLGRTFAEKDARDEGDDFLACLGQAAEQFLVRRGATDVSGAPVTATAGASVIAGYPWFEDWGRDTFVSLAGLTLVPGRYGEARSILATFADHMRRGLLPNRFPDKAVTPDYNTVDASLWFVHAAYQYWRYSGDAAFLTKYLYPKLCEVMESYRDGTDFGIRMESDGLIRAGDGNHQPTWMDAKIGDWVVTPRHGKAVEINALWYSNLKVMALVAKTAGDATRSLTFGGMAEQVARVFEGTYFNNSTKCLYDVIGDEGPLAGPDGSIRPNQLFAVSLPFSPLSTEAKIGVVATCQKHLLTPMGMRTLSPEAPQYQGHYTGDPRSRDSAYHQGTVWPWLMGPFVSAYMNVRGRGESVREEAAVFLRPFHAHLKQAGLGSISEIADGDTPHTPRGCPAQAWSVGEVLRAYYEEVLGRAPAWPHEDEKK